jgi:hypothetical protein
LWKEAGKAGSVDITTKLWSRGTVICFVKKVKQSRYRPGVAQRVQEVKVKQSRYRPEVAQRVQEVKVKQSRYRPEVAQRDPGS